MHGGPFSDIYSTSLDYMHLRMMMIMIMIMMMIMIIIAMTWMMFSPQAPLLWGWLVGLSCSQSSPGCAHHLIMPCVHLLAHTGWFFHWHPVAPALTYRFILFVSAFNYCESRRVFWFKTFSSSAAIFWIWAEFEQFVKPLLTIIDCTPAIIKYSQLLKNRKSI